MVTTRAPRSDVRTRILETADRLFYAEGVRAVGVDRIIAEAGVAKMSLYNHFPSKDDLILAVLDHRGRTFDEMFADRMAHHTLLGNDPIGSFFAALKEWFESPGYRGCMFINTRSELGASNQPSADLSSACKAQFHTFLHQTLVDAVGPELADETAPPIALLVEGAIVMAVMEQTSRAAETAERAARAVIAQARRA
jgi:AcrR family transcriptional regulator